MAKTTIKVPQSTPLAASAYRVEFDPQKANLDSIMAAVKELLGRSGCANCGRLSILDVRFDPRVQLEREIPGVLSVSELTHQDVAIQQKF